MKVSELVQCIITEKQPYYDETRKRAHDLETVRAEENLKLSHGWDWSLSIYDPCFAFTFIMPRLKIDTRILGSNGTQVSEVILFKGSAKHQYPHIPNAIGY